MGTKGTLSNIAWQARIADTGGYEARRSGQRENVPEDFDLLTKAAEKRWPDAVITNSRIVFGLAKIPRSSALRRPRPKYYKYKKTVPSAPVKKRGEKRDRGGIPSLREQKNTFPSKQKRKHKIPAEPNPLSVFFATIAS